MPDDPERRYWDSCVFLSYINGMPDRVPDIKAIMLDVQRSNGSKEIITSTFSIAEVAFGAQEQQRKAVDPAIEAEIDKLWADESIVKLVEFHEIIAREARTIMRTAITKGWSLKGKDAVHLATAKLMSVVEFNTYDSGLFRYGPELGFTIQAPKAQQAMLI